MATSGRKRKGKTKHKPINKLFKPTPNPTTLPDDLSLSQIIPHLISSASAAHSFLLNHDLHLHPSQSLSLESLLSSNSRSLAHLISLLSLPIPPTPPLLPPPRPTWFHRFISSSPDYDPRWVQFFGLSKPSFTLLLRLLAPSLTPSLYPFPPNAALAATLFRLSHAASFSAVARRFSFDSPSAACRAFYTVCKAILDNLGHLFEFSRVIVGFGWNSLPNCCGVLGIERFESEGGFGNGSMLVQGLVDSEGRFLDVSAGWPGTKKPEDVLRKSQLFSGVEHSSEFLNGPCFDFNGGGGGGGDSIPQYVLGDSCYPLLPWLLTPYSEEEGELGSSEMAFNDVHRRGMELVGTAFAQVKNRWKLVGKKWTVQCTEAFPFVIVACCLLHNYLIKCSESLPEVNVGSSRDRGGFPVFDGEDSESGKRTRDALAFHLSRSKAVRNMGSFVAISLLPLIFSLVFAFGLNSPEHICES